MSLSEHDEESMYIQPVRVSKLSRDLLTLAGDKSSKQAFRVHFAPLAK